MQQVGNGFAIIGKKLTGRAYFFFRTETAKQKRVQLRKGPRILMHVSSTQRRELNETEKRIREGALRLFGQKGFQATTTRELAAEAGLTVAGLYYYVGTKEELLL